jgi:hypothetical protein
VLQCGGKRLCISPLYVQVNVHNTDCITPLADVTSIFDPTCLELSGQSVMQRLW